MDDDDNPSPAIVNYLVFNVADGTATPEEARRLVAAFVRQASTNPKQIDPRLIDHLRDCFAAYLAGRKVLEPAPSAGRDARHAVTVKSMDKAMGLVRPTRGQPPIDLDTQGEVAALILQELLRGGSLEDAVATVSASRKEAGLPITSETQVRDCWAKNKYHGLVTLRVMRLTERDDRGFWTPDEFARLVAIYKDVSGVVLPGETPFEGRHALGG